VRSAPVFAIALALPSLAWANVLVSQVPVSGGGVLRWSQLWQDPSPAGNNLDGDSVCWEDFTVTQPTAISHIEWWGNGASELGFQIEFWPQDPNTAAYQPLAVFEYGYYGQGNPPVTPTDRFIKTRADFTASIEPDGLTHYLLDLAYPVTTLPANDGTNPHWFIGSSASPARPT